MGEPAFGLRRRLPRITVAMMLAGTVAACAGGPQNAAPVFLKGAGAGPEPTEIVPPPAPPRPPPQRIVVRPGQSLSRIAHEYRVSERAIIAANQLKPPYKVEAGQRLLIPGATPPPPHMASAAPPPAVPAPYSPPPAPAARPPADSIPLDGPTQPKAIAFPPQAAPPTLKPPAEPAAVEEPRAAEEPRGGPALPRGAHFPWPVRGRVLAAYGARQGGGHNDGINIAAPRGAPVRAVEAGTVAYAGNELRGYGNLVLVKHDNGLITAYAHCDDLLVKRGDKVGRGQVIAKVGTTGGVAEPQLHFELRRGKRAVDPREFLAPAPSAGHGEPSDRG
jgi:murein DD-endopeptidase MepM/ murein hydrolase activator NlpD